MPGASWARCPPVSRSSGCRASSPRRWSATGSLTSEAIVFDTHGESMGRGGHPGGIVDRCLYACSPWARRQFSGRGIHLVHEQSFQGGDGYVWFTGERMARRTLVGILKAHGEARAASDDDPFYRDTATSLDFFNAVKKRQEELFVDPAYNIALGAMGLAILPKTGSRKSRRQFERGADEETSLRRIRAIPHNAVLQQMGLLANILGGVGGALAVEPEAYARLARRSDRFARIMRLVATANSHSEMKTLIAYMKLYDGSFWATRPISGEERALEAPCAVLAEALSEDHRYFTALQLAARLRSDAISLTRILGQMDLPPRGHAPVSLDLLHAVRLAAIQHCFLIAARLPTFTPQGGFNREDVMALIFTLDVPQACETLRETFPTDPHEEARVSLDEPADYPADASPGARLVPVSGAGRRRRDREREDSRRRRSRTQRIGARAPATETSGSETSRISSKVAAKPRRSPRRRGRPTRPWP